MVVVPSKQTLNFTANFLAQFYGVAIERHRCWQFQSTSEFSLENQIHLNKLHFFTEG